MATPTSAGPVPAPTLALASAPAPPRPLLTRRERHRRHVIFWVFAGAMSSGAFAFLGAGIIIAAYYTGWIPLWAIQEIANKIWPFVCIIEITLQVIPMNVRQQTQGWDVVADQWTSFLPMVGCAVVLTAMFFGKLGMGPEGWRIWSASLGVAIIELMLLSVSNKLIAAARGSEETAV